jgi:hypothetical protein
MLIGVIGFLFTPGAPRQISLAIFALHTANVLPLAVLVDPQFRYQIESLPIAFIGAGLGLFRITTCLPRSI